MAKYNNNKLPPWAGIEPEGPILRPPDAAEYYGVGLSTYYQLAEAGHVPKPMKLADRARSSGVPKPFLDAVIAARVSASN